MNENKPCNECDRMMVNNLSVDMMFDDDDDGVNRSLTKRNRIP